MDFQHLNRRFAAIGARLRIESYDARREGDPGYRLDVREQARRGEHFVVRLAHDGPRDLDLSVPVIDVRRRHLILQARRDDSVRQFLCGHDERHWFVAGLPRNVTGLDDAFAALMPGAVLRADRKRRLRNRRHDHAWKRQGEWFFVPAPELDGRWDLVYHRDEPLRRGGGKPHVAERLYRTGGEDVYVNPAGTRIYTPAEFGQLRRHNWTEARAARTRAERRAILEQPWNLRLMRRQPDVFVSGRITHPDHATLVLDGWHRVWPNAEPESGPLRFGNPVTFLD